MMLDCQRASACARRLVHSAKRMVLACARRSMQEQCVAGSMHMARVETWVSGIEHLEQTVIWHGVWYDPIAFWRRRIHMAKQSANGKRIGRPPRTHCKNGHEFTPENTSIVKSGRYKGERRCKTCITAGKQKQMMKLRQESAKRKESWFF